MAAACAQRPEQLFQSAQDLYKAGRFVDATAKAKEGYQRFKNPQSVWHWKFAILSAELQLLHGKTKTADDLLADGPPVGFKALTPRWEMLHAYALARHKSYPLSQQFFERALTDAHAAHDSATEADAWLWRGMSRLSSDQFANDEAYFRHAQDLATSNHLDWQLAEALNDRGLVHIKRERYADAIPLLQASRDSADRAGATFISALALNNLAECYESLGDLDRALDAQKNSVERQEHFGLETLLSNGYSELGSIYLKKGQSRSALQYFRKAFQLISNDAPSQYSLAAGNLAGVLQQTGALDEAEHFNQIALQFASPNDSSSIASLTSTQAAIAERRGNHDQALKIYQTVLGLGVDAPSVLWQAYAAIADIYSAKADFRNADNNYAKALSVIASNRADQLESDYKITFLSNLIRFYQDYVDLLMQHGQENRALEIADSSRASVLTEDLLGQSAPTRAHLLSQIHNAAKVSHSVFLFYWLAPKTSYLWAISATQDKAVRLTDQQQIAQDVNSYRTLVEETKGNPLSPTPSHAGTQLFRELIAPVASLIPPNGRVVIIPDGVLHNLNFETLIASAPQPHYWIEDATISVAPSLSILRAGKSLATSHGSLLLMGDPITTGTGYAPLPEAALEIANIQRRFPAADSTVLTGAKAFVDAYIAAKPQNFSTIHFATHVDANAQSPLDSAIILSPQSGRFSLYARDVARTPLNADLVTISACRGAGARTLSGEGLVGFAWAFFQARTQNVVTSLWDVSDNSTAQLMDDFYASVTTGHSYALSLRAAKLKMLQSSNYKRPYYWAPFQLYSRTIAASSN